MKGIVTLALLAVLGGAAARAEETDAPGGSHFWNLPHRVEGTVQSVDHATGKVTIKDKNGWTKTFSAHKGTKVTEAEKDTRFDNVAVGDQVNITYKGKKAMPDVKKIQVSKNVPR